MDLDKQVPTMDPEQREFLDLLAVVGDGGQFFDSSVVSVNEGLQSDTTLSFGSAPSSGEGLALARTGISSDTSTVATSGIWNTPNDENSISDATGSYYLGKEASTDAPTYTFESAAHPPRIEQAASLVRSQQQSLSNTAQIAALPSIADSSAAALTNSSFANSSRPQGPPSTPCTKDVPPHKGREQCTKCNKMCQSLQASDTGICLACRLQSAAGTKSTEEEGEAIVLPAEYAALAAGKRWDAKITDAEAARKHLRENPMYSVRVPGDNFMHLDNRAIDAFSRKLFGALLEAPVHLPNPPDEAKRTEYRERQLQAFVKCAKLMETDDQVSDASARCRLAIEEAVALHRDGMLLSHITQDSLAAIASFNAKPNKTAAAPRPKT